MSDIWIPSILFVFILMTTVFTVIFRRDRPTWKIGIVCLLAIAEINYAIVMLHLSADIQHKLFWYKMIFAGSTVVPTGFLILALLITGYKRFTTPKYLGLFSIMPILGNVILFTNEFHGLDWNPANSVPIAISMDYPPLPDIGFVFWFWIGHSTLCLLLGIILLIQKSIQTKGINTWEFTGWILAALFGLSGVMLDIFDLTSFKPFTMTVFGFTVFTILVVFLLSDLRRRDIIAISRGTVFNNIEDGIIVIDGNQTIIDVNPTILRLTPSPKKSLIGLPLEQVFPEISSVLSTTDRLFNAIVLEVDQQKFFFDLRVSSIVDLHETKLSQVIVLRDVTKQKASEEITRYFTEGTHAIFWRAIVTHDQQGENGTDQLHWDTQYANLEAVNDFIPFQDYPSLLMRDKFYYSEDEEDRDRMYKTALEAIISGAEGYSQEFRIKDTKGVIHWMFEEAKITRLGPDRFEVTGLITEITDRKRFEEEILRLNTELERKVQERTAELENANMELRKTNNELEAFSYSVSHDLRQPLRAIAGFSNIIQTQYSDQFDSEGKRLFNLIEKNTLKMDLIINDMLKLSRISRSEINLSKINMRNLVEIILDDLALPETQRQAVMISSLPDCDGDPVLIQQVLSNLISNAVKYTSQTSDRKIEIGSYPADESIVYFVKDNGVGFNPDYADKLFIAFQRLHTDNEFEGSGIGLAIVKRIIDRHGGRVWAEGKLNEGSTFFFALPAKKTIQA